MAVLATAGALAATACGADPNSISSQAQAGDRKGYVSGDGSVEQIPVTARGKPISLVGTTLEGRPWNLASVPNSTVVVLNVWGSWCGPCVAEAPDLEKTWSQLHSRNAPVQFVGLNFKEDPAAGLAFQRRYALTYPSLQFDGGRPVQALNGQAPAVPTTLVLDPSRRIAARILGQTDTTTLTGVIDDVIAQQVATPSPAADPRAQPAPTTASPR